MGEIFHQSPLNKHQSPGSQGRSENFKVRHKVVSSFADVTNHPHRCQLCLNLNNITLGWCHLQTMLDFLIDSHAYEIGPNR